MVHRRNEGYRGRLVAYLLVIAAAAACAGCNNEACFVWTEAEGACPSRDEAAQFFSVPGCYGPIESVDSEGEFIVDDEDPIAGDLCCYTVTKSGEDYAFCEGGF